MPTELAGENVPGGGRFVAPAPISMRTLRPRVDRSRSSDAAIPSPLSQNATLRHRAPAVSHLGVMSSVDERISSHARSAPVAFCNSGARGVVGRFLRLVAKQQTTALLATVADYAVMTACASGGGVSPPLATACGALIGAVVGFVLARRWVFRAVEATPLVQAWRYLAVSVVSLAANAAGEALLVRAGLHYLAARPIISVTVGLAWNLPMQQLFVFRRRRLAVASVRRERRQMG